MQKELFDLAKGEDPAVTIVDQLKVAGFSDIDVSVLFPDRPGADISFLTSQRKAVSRTAAPTGSNQGAFKW